MIPRFAQTRMSLRETWDQEKKKKEVLYIHQAKLSSSKTPFVWLNLPNA